MLEIKNNFKEITIHQHTPCAFLHFLSFVKFCDENEGLRSNLNTDEPVDAEDLS
jgi:hypothetical protein